MGGKDYGSTVLSGGRMPSQVCVCVYSDLAFSRVCVCVCR